MKINSIKFKISVIYTLILGVILILYSGFLYLSLYNTLYDDLDRELKTKAQAIQKTTEQYMEIIGDDPMSLTFAVRRSISLKGGHPDKTKILTAEQKKNILELEKTWANRYDKLDLSEDFIHFAKINGQSLVKSANISTELRTTFLKKLKSREKNGISFTKFKFKKKNLRFIQVPFPYKRDEKYILQMGTSQKPILDLLENRQFYIFISIPVILLLTSFIGRFLAVRILNPVKEITTLAKDITHEDLSRRITAEYADEEVHMLVQSFNDMIGRLEKSFQHINEFSSHVAHELKTPIAIIRGEAELALRKDRTSEEYKRVIQVSLGESRRLLKTVEDLLLLAKLDYKPEIFHFEKIDLSRFFHEIFEQTKILALEKSIQTKFTQPEKPLEINADKLHLRRLFFNIIHNAIKFTPPEGYIEIKVTNDNKIVSVEIRDSGAGIIKEDIPKIFERFYHIDRRENIHADGNGLGLNIARAIAKIHHGNIKVASQPDQGSTFTVILPRS